MRLLNTSTYQLESFLGTKKPSYAILSHTWEPEGEIKFQDLEAGFRKVRHACERALKDGYNYVWIDTCCIDKSSSAELSEAINSMFRWYQQSAICYAFFSDVRWFTRGCTLQELIAPNEVDLYDKHWEKLGSRSSCAQEISRITCVQKHVLIRTGRTVDSVLRSVSVAQRMQWAESGSLRAKKIWLIAS
ncbi:het domain protein [Stagonosporopsis vannaccii]|nr:het domain protein [Stagonosporopsis vannaccii]